jgi:hypothetical protein
VNPLNVKCSYSTFDPFQILFIAHAQQAVRGKGGARAGDDAVIGQGGGIGRVETAAGRSEGDAAFCIEGEGGGGREDAAVERKVPGSSGARGGAESRILRCVCSRSAGSEPFGCGVGRARRARRSVEDGRMLESERDWQLGGRTPRTSASSVESRGFPTFGCGVWRLPTALRL